MTKCLSCNREEGIWKEMTKEEWRIEWDALEDLRKQLYLEHEKGLWTKRQFTIRFNKIMHLVSILGMNNPSIKARLNPALLEARYRLMKPCGCMKQDAEMRGRP